MRVESWADIHTSGEHPVPQRKGALCQRSVRARAGMCRLRKTGLGTCQASNERCMQSIGCALRRQAQAQEDADLQWHIVRSRPRGEGRSGRTSYARTSPPKYATLSTARPSHGFHDRHARPSKCNISPVHGLPGETHPRRDARAPRQLGSPVGGSIRTQHQPLDSTRTARACGCLPRAAPALPVRGPVAKRLPSSDSVRAHVRILNLSTYVLATARPGESIHSLPVLGSTATDRRWRKGPQALHAGAGRASSMSARRCAPVGPIRACAREPPGETCDGSPSPRACAHDVIAGALGNAKVQSLFSPSPSPSPSPERRRARPHGERTDTAYPSLTIPDAHARAAISSLGEERWYATPARARDDATAEAVLLGVAGAEDDGTIVAAGGSACLACAGAGDRGQRGGAGSSGPY